MLGTTPHSIVNTIGRTYVFSWGVNKHGLPITITKSVWSSIQFLRMLYRRFAKAMQVPMCKSNWEGLEIMINNLSDTHIPYFLQKPAPNKYGPSPENVCTFWYYKCKLVSLIRISGVESQRSMPFFLSFFIFVFVGLWFCKFKCEVT